MKCKSRVLTNDYAYTLVEIVLTTGLIAIVSTVISLSFLRFRDGMQYDILINQITESINFAKIKATTSKLDEGGNRISYGVKFSDNQIIEFNGDAYVEDAETNAVYDVPIGLRLSTLCSPNNNGEIYFSPITGEAENICTIFIYKFEQTLPAGSVVVQPYGIQEAS